jgi:hypothetical protein
MLDV